MPLFNFRCERCQSVFETLVGHREKKKICCPRCGGASERQDVSFFNIAGRLRTGNAALIATGGDFVSNPDKFVTAMETFGEKIGDRLSSRQMDKAVEKLKQARDRTPPWI